MKTNSDFSDAKVGDLVTSLTMGYGVITQAHLEDEDYQIYIKFDKGGSDWYIKNGYCQHNHFAPTLFKGHIDINSLQVTYNTLPDAT